MAAKKNVRSAKPAPSVVEQPVPERVEPELPEELRPTGAAEQTPTQEPEPGPTGVDEDPCKEPEPDPGAEPLPKEYVVLDGPASYGPVMIGAKRVRALKAKLYHVPDMEERLDVLGTGRFRAATRADLARSGSPSAGQGGSLTRDLLPPGAVKGGLLSHEH